MLCAESLGKLPRASGRPHRLRLPLTPPRHYQLTGPRPHTSHTHTHITHVHTHIHTHTVSRSPQPTATVCTAACAVCLLLSIWSPALGRVDPWPGPTVGWPPGPCGLLTSGGRRLSRPLPGCFCVQTEPPGVLGHVWLLQVSTAPTGSRPPTGPPHLKHQGKASPCHPAQARLGPSLLSRR